MRTLLLFCSVLALIVFLEANVEAAEKSLRWRIKNPAWTEEHEKNFEYFVNRLGKARKNGVCKTLDECLRNETANPLYASRNPSGLASFYSDCADLPFVLRGYFAWMNDLPFSFPTGLVAAVSLSKKATDIRYSKYGNIITEKYFVKNYDNINRILVNIVDSISTGSLRTNPEKADSGRNFRDTYSVSIDRKFLVPGTVVYDPNGHIAVVYEVTSTGQVHMIDSHPDNTLTTITYGEKFPRSGLKVGAGFSRFRPFSVENGLSVSRNADLPGHSLLQYQDGPFIWNGKAVSFYEFVRLKLSEGEIVYDPMTEFSDLLDEICLDTKYREEAVNVAIKAGIDRQRHPDVLPKNIYGTEGDWEAYATPSRDARLKAIVRGTRDYLKKVINGYSSKKLKIKYEGKDLIADLREIYEKKSGACYVRPDSKTVLNLDDVLKKIYDLSFDPYHCPLLRWGIDDKSCKDRDWYFAETGLRNRIAIDYNLKTDYNVDELPSAPASQNERQDLSFDDLLQIDRLTEF